MTLAELSWPDIAALAAQDAIAILPVAAVEQHGPHLPLTTDTDLVTAVATAAEQQLRERVVLCPSLPYGSSHHHLAFPGTLSLAPDLFTNVIVDLCRSLARSSGFRRIVILNGHGGNITPVRQALAMLAHAPDTSSAEIALVTYWELANPAFAGTAPMESPALSHACEYETSMMLHLHAGRVRMDRVRRAERPASNGYIGWEDDEPYRGVSIVHRTEFISSNGSSGEPQKATPAKGQHLVDAAVRALVEFLENFATWPVPPEDLRHHES